MQRRAGLFEPPGGASSGTLRILRKNADGLFAKRLELRGLLKTEKTDAFLVQEI